MTVKRILKGAGPLVVMCAVLLVVSNANAVIEIDHFEDDFLVTAGGGIGGSVLTVDSTVDTTSTAAQTGLADVYGGDRTAVLTYLSGTGTTSATAEAINDTPPAHFLELTNGADDRSSLSITYDGDAGGGNLGDLTEGGLAMQIILRVLKADLNASVTIEFEDGDGSIDSQTQTVLTDIAPPGMALFFNYASYNASVDFTNIARMTVILTDVGGTDAVDFQIDSIESGVIPEPLTMLGMFIGLGGVGAYIRKRRMA